MELLASMEILGSFLKAFWKHASFFFFRKASWKLSWTSSKGFWSLLKLLGSFPEAFWKLSCSFLEACMKLLGSYPEAFPNLVESLSKALLYAKYFVPSWRSLLKFMKFPESFWEAFLKLFEILFQSHWKLCKDSFQASTKLIGSINEASLKLKLSLIIDFRKISCSFFPWSFM